MTVFYVDDLKRLTGEDFSHKRKLIRPRVEYAPLRRRWYAYRLDGSWGFFWEWEDAITWAVSQAKK